MSVDETELKIEQKVAVFSQQADWITVDSYIDYIGVTQGHREVSELTCNDGNNSLAVSQSFFSIFDYVPNTEITLITSKSLKDVISIKSESNVNIKVTYTDFYNLPISNNYPKIYYIKQNSSESWKQANLAYAGNNDYSINNELFHWQSQSTTTPESKTGQRYIDHRRLGTSVMIFVREYKSTKLGAAPYTFLGLADYVKSEGSKPMNVVWKLTKPIPAKYLKKTNQLTVG